MKIRPEDYQRLKDEIRAALKRDGKTFDEVFVEQTVRGHSTERIRWDLFHNTGLRITRKHNVRDDRDLPLYDYLNDDHIDTALRRIVTELHEETCP